MCPDEYYLGTCGHMVTAAYLTGRALATWSFLLMVVNKSKHWCFTLNNPTDADRSRLESLSESSSVTYLVYGRETGESGTPHLQGYISFVNRKTFGGAKNALGTRVHLERARGTPTENAEYCKKDGDFFEHGEVPVSQGARTDLTGACAGLKEGKRIRVVAQEFPEVFVKYPRGLTQLSHFCQPDFVGPRKVFLFTGASGAGKTRAVVEAEPDLFRHGGDRWFDGYEGQEAALLDDFDGKSLDRQVFLWLTDQYPCSLPVKGGFVKWLPKRVYITSNFPMSSWYPGLLAEAAEAVNRRFHVIKEFSKSTSGFSVRVVRDVEPEFTALVTE